MSRKGKASNGQLAPLKADDQLLVSKMHSRLLEFKLNAEDWNKKAEGKRVELITLLASLATRRGHVFGTDVNFDFENLAFIPMQTIAPAPPPAPPEPPPPEKKAEKK